MVDSRLKERISAVRRFNRFFTRQIGVLREGLLHSPYSLTEARIIFELANRSNLTAANLGSELGLDAGYLSRILTKLEQQKLIQKTRSNDDRRQRLISLTPAGQAAFALLDNRSNDEVSELLGELSAGDQRRLIEAMHTIEDILDHGFKICGAFLPAPSRGGRYGLGDPSSRPAVSAGVWLGCEL